MNSVIVLYVVIWHTILQQDIIVNLQNRRKYAISVLKQIELLLCPFAKFYFLIE